MCDITRNTVVKYVPNYVYSAALAMTMNSSFQSADILGKAFNNKSGIELYLKE